MARLDDCLKLPHTGDHMRAGLPSVRSGQRADPPWLRETRIEHEVICSFRRKVFAYPSTSVIV
jgi:hypothetical protein